MFVPHKLLEKPFFLLKQLLKDGDLGVRKCRSMVPGDVLLFPAPCPAQGSGGGLRVPSLCPGQCLGCLGRGRWCCSFHSSNGPGNAVFPLTFQTTVILGKPAKPPPLGMPAWPFWGFWSFLFRFLFFFFFFTFFKSWGFVCLFVDLDLLKSIW